MACFPWFYMLTRGYVHPAVAAKDFLSIEKYKNAYAWMTRLMARPEVQRGVQVCRGVGKPWLEKKDKSKL